MKPYNQKPLSLAARVMCFVGASVGLSLLLIGNLVLNVVERHFAEQDAEEVAVINKAVIDVLRNNNDNNLQLSKALFGAVSGHHGVYYQVGGFRKCRRKPFSSERQPSPSYRN